MVGDEKRRNKLVKHKGPAAMRVLCVLLYFVLLGDYPAVEVAACEIA